METNKQYISYRLTRQTPTTPPLTPTEKHVRVMIVHSDEWRVSLRPRLRTPLMYWLNYLKMIRLWETNISPASPCQNYVCGGKHAFPWGFLGNVHGGELEGFGAVETRSPSCSRVIPRRKFIWIETVAIKQSCKPWRPVCAWWMSSRKRRGDVIWTPQTAAHVGLFFNLNINLWK